MTTDSGAPHRRPVRDIWSLPEIVSVSVRHRRFDSSRRITVRGEDHYLDEGLEVIVRLSAPLPIRALGPVLWVGDQPLSIAESDGEREYRFLAPEPEALQEGAPIALSWGTGGARQGENRHHFEPPGELRAR